MKALSQAPIERFISSIKVEDNGCWVWTKGRFASGYGAFSFLKKTVKAHRYAMFALRGIPFDLKTIDHLCRNRACVNPEHLECVDIRTNILRSPLCLASINAKKTHCLHGHELIGKNIMRVKGKARRCRTCHNLTTARNSKKMKSKRASK